MLTLVPERFAVVTPLGVHLFWVDEARARELIAERKVRFFRRGGKMRILVALTAELLDTKGSKQGSPKYSHDHEVSETYLGDDGQLKHRNPLDANPKGCWTLRRLPRSTRQLYRTVVAGCVA